jgi:hypothetical protein
LTTPKYGSFGNHLPGLLLILVLIALPSSSAAARTSKVRTALPPAGLERGGAEVDKLASRDLMLTERSRRVTTSPNLLGTHVSSTSEVIFNSMPKLLSASGPAIQPNATIRVPVKLGVSLDAWPGLNFRGIWAAAGATPSTAIASDGDVKRHPVRVSTTDSGASGSQGGAPVQKPRGIVSTAPMTAGEKFTYFLKRGFASPAPYGLSVLSGVILEGLFDKNEHHQNDAGGFMADAMTHAARSFAFRSTAGFFEKFAYATMFKQDPRYHRSNNVGFGAKVGYAISRVFITQGDRGGRQFNASFIVGGLSAAGMSNLWERDEHVNVGDTFVRWGEHVGFTALFNVLREFIGGQ